jgi:hypothetical protein
MFPIVYLSNCLTWQVWHGWLASQNKNFYSQEVFYHLQSLPSGRLHIFVATDVGAEVYREIAEVKRKVFNSGYENVRKNLQKTPRLIVQIMVRKCE